MQQKLQDANGRPIGVITTTYNGKMEARDANGHPKGVYDPQTDVTRDNNGWVVGRGNLLAMLLAPSHRK